MKKKFTLILLTLVCTFACALGLAACGITTLDTPTHEHVWASAWSASETNHWHACAVSGCSEKNGNAAHDFTNGDCVCGAKKATDGLEFTLNSSGDGYSVSKGTATDAEIFIPATYNGKPVTSIGDDAFYNCDSLTSITIPSGVTSIGGSAFYNCSNLETVNWNATNCTSAGSVEGYSDTTIFQNCSKLTTMNIGDNVTTIPSFAFYNCTGLTSITIPNSVTSIGDYALTNCSGLERITVANENTKYHSAGNCLIETATKTLIAGCKNSVIPTDGSVTSIGGYAFYNCTGLTSITIPNSVTSIGSVAFYNCTGLTSITIPNSVTSIGSVAFYNCTGLTSITIPNSVTSIGSAAFLGCNKVMRIDYNGDIVSWCGMGGLGNLDNSKVYINGEKLTEMTSITIPEGVTSIRSGAFYDCCRLIIYCEAASKQSGWDSSWNRNSYVLESYCPVVWDCKNNNKDESGYEYSIINGIRYGLKDGEATVVGQPTNISGAITIPTSVTYKENNYSVTSIGGYAFSDCSSLTSITIPNGVTYIGDYAFSGCSSLTSITIPNGVTYIGSWAFYGCSSLTSITFNDTKAQWKAVGKGYKWNYNTGNYTIYCTDGNLDKNGKEIA